MICRPMDTARRVYLETFGCQMNVADSEVALAQLARMGFAPVTRVDDADLVLYNTCSVRDSAEAKIRGRLDYWKTHKRPGLVVGVLGCMAQRLGIELIERWPQVDLVAGSDQLIHLDHLLQRLEREDHVVAIDFGDAADEVHPAQRGAGINAWVPVMRGCNYRCTYCIVPKTRGRERSRPPTVIEEEVRAAVAAGYRQVTLLGQTIDAYGKTLGDGSTLAGLLRRLHPIDGLERLRFVTSHPKDVTDELLHAMAELPKVAKHLHVPAQSGSSRILRLMGRRYDRAGYLDMVARARRIVPGVELLTDMIVGFPTESDDDFQDTVSLMRTVGFDGAFVFMYSPRPGTGATRLADDVPVTVKRRRCNTLLELQLAQQEARHRTLVGETVEILVEGPTRTNPDRLQGRTLGNRTVMFARHDAAGADRDALIGTRQQVRIDDATNLSLFGEVVAG